MSSAKVRFALLPRRWIERLYKHDVFGGLGLTINAQMHPSTPVTHQILVTVECQTENSAHSTHQGADMATTVRVLVRLYAGTSE